MNLTLTPVAISGAHGPRSPMFGGAANDFFGMGASTPAYRPSYARYAMGQTAQDAYQTAKREIARFDALVERTKRIAGKVARDTVISDFGLSEPENKDKALYMRNALAFDVADAEKYTPVAYEQGFPAQGPSRGRVAKLQSFNQSFEAAVTNGENTTGILPEPVVIEKVVTVAGAVPSFVPYVVVGAIGVAALFALGVFE